jgi:hypothetical protein
MKSLVGGEPTMNPLVSSVHTIVDLRTLHIRVLSFRLILMMEYIGTLYSVTFLTFLISYLDYSRTYEFTIPIARS